MEKKPPPDDRALSFDFTPRERPPEPPKKAAREEPRVLSVGELDRAIKRTLDVSFEQPVWVEGEVTGARPAPSGHLYFCLRDEAEEASIDVVVYRTNVTPRARTLVKDGARVRLRGQPTFWVPRGKLQMVADRVQAVGRGALLEAIERLKEKLQAEGLFAPEKKRELPAEARIVGVVTSATGAVIHDVVKVAFRRGGARILLAPAQVQGANAAESIRRALAQLQRVPGVDVIIVGRGGGSADDLLVFNEESVVRAVAACRVPVVSAVGHEVDVTLTDFAADARAATPSQAAEMVVPDKRARAAQVLDLKRHLARAMRARLAEERVTLERLARRVSDPRLAIASSQQLVDELGARLASYGEAAIARRREALVRVQHRLSHQHPRAVIDRERAAIARAHDRIVAVGRTLVERRASEVARAAARLDAMSPLAVLARGYAIATRADDGRALRGASDARPGDAVRIRVHRARVDATVTGVEPIEEEKGE